MTPGKKRDLRFYPIVGLDLGKRFIKLENHSFFFVFAMVLSEQCNERDGLLLTYLFVNVVTLLLLLWTCNVLVKVMMR